MTNTPSKSGSQKPARQPQTARKTQTGPGAPKGAHNRSAALPDVATLITAYGIVSGAAESTIVGFIKRANESATLPAGTYWFDTESLPVSLYENPEGNTTAISSTREPDFIQSLLSYCEQPIIKTRVTEFVTASNDLNV